jgi:hypothetical protein
VGRLPDASISKPVATDDISVAVRQHLKPSVQRWAQNQGLSIPLFATVR